jgi:hypothetical protein
MDSGSRATRSAGMTTDIIRIFSERGDLAHLALLLWAASASALAWFARFNESFHVPGAAQREVMRRRPGTAKL